jgi:hypothetical protein
MKVRQACTELLTHYATVCVRYSLTIPMIPRNPGKVNEELSKSLLFISRILRESGYFCPVY